MMILETERLRLREFALDDWPAVLAYQDDPLYLRYYAWMERSEADVRRFVQMFLDWQHETPRLRFQLAVTLKGEDRLIGNCGIRIDDERLRQGNIGYEIDSRYWGRGCATEAARRILAFGFEELGLHRIWATCLAENGASARVLAKLGMRQEACEREKEYIRGAWHDSLTYALLDRDWKEGKGSD